MARPACATRTRRRKAGHDRRERIAAAGMLLQADGSDEAWLEERGPRLTLVAAIDDTSNVVTAGYFATLTETAHPYGLPLGRSTPTATACSPSVPTARRRSPSSSGASGRSPRSRRALDEAGIAWIGASSPKAA
ncbi:MAG: hypothetical protein ABSC46_12180 [Candidatus Limnocylindrales bacterium]